MEAHRADAVGSRVEQVAGDGVDPRPVKFDHERGTWTHEPDAQGYYEVKTWWRTFDDFVAWTQSPAFAEAHANRPPREMFAGPNVLEVHEIVTSTDLPLERDETSREVR